MTNSTGFSFRLGFLLCFSFLSSHIGFAEEVQKNSVGADFSVSNSLSAGTFMGPAEREPSLSSRFRLNPYYKTPGLFNDKKIKFYGDLSLNVEWLDSSNTTATNPSRTPKISDLALHAKMDNIWSSKDLGLGITPGIKLEIPLSTPSHDANRVFALGTTISAIWAKSGFSVNYKPGITGYIHSENYKSSLCTGTNTDSSNPQTVLANGKCLVNGQQTLALLENGLYLAYEIGPHSITTGVKTYNAFLRKSTDPKNTKNYSFSTLGLIEYAYAVPIKIPFYLSLGLASYQPGFNENGNLNFPFFDFKTPSNSGFYFGVDASI